MLALLCCFQSLLRIKMRLNTLEAYTKKRHFSTLQGVETKLRNEYNKHNQFIKQLLNEYINSFSDLLEGAIEL